MLRKQPKGKKKVSSEQPTKGGWQMDQQAEPKKGSGIKNLFKMLLLFISIGLIGLSFFLSSDGGVASITADNKTNDNNGKLVHVTGQLSSKELEDPMFIIKHEGVGLKRIVEMYQWVESGGDYAKEWKSEIIALSQDAGGKVNPPEMSFLSESWKVDKFDLGTFGLSDSIAEKVTNYIPLELTQENFSKLNKHGQAAFKLHEGMYFWGHDPNNPIIGDLRVRFEKADAGTYSVLAKQTGGNLSVYTDGGTAIEKVARGNVSLETMLKGVDAGGSGMMPLIFRIIGGLAFIVFVLTLVLGRKKSPKMSKVKVNEENTDSSNSKAKNSEAVIPATAAAAAVASDDGFNSDNFDDEVLEEMDMEEEDYASEPAATNKEQDSLPTLDNSGESYDDFNDDIPDSIEMVSGYDSDSDDDNELPEGIEMIGGDEFSDNLPKDDHTEYESLPVSDNYEDDNEVADGIEMIGGDDSEKESSKSNYLEFESLPEESESEDDNELPEGIEMIGGEDFEEELPKSNSLEFEPSIEEDPEDNNEIPAEIEIIEDDLPELEEEDSLEFEPSIEEDAEDNNEIPAEIEIIEDDLPELEEEDSLEFEPSIEEDAEDNNEIPAEIEIIEDDLPELEEDDSLEFEPSIEEDAEDNNEIPAEIEIIEDELPELEEDDSLEFEPSIEDDVETEGEVPDLPSPMEFLNNNQSVEVESEVVDEETTAQDSDGESSFGLEVGNIPDDFDPNAEMEIDNDEDIEIDYDTYVDEDSDIEIEDDKKNS